MSILDILEKIDLYGLSFPLHFKEKSTYSSIKGRVLSLVSIIIALLLTIYFSLEYYNKVNYTFNSKKVYESNEKIINLTNNNFMLGILNHYNKYEEIDKSYFSLCAKIIKCYKYPNQNSNNNVIYNKIKYSKEVTELEKYNYNYLDNYIQDSIDEDDDYNKNLYFSKNKNIYYSGNIKNLYNNYSYINLSVKKCNNNTYNNQCKRKEEIEKKLDNISLSIHFNTYHLDFNN